MKKLIASLSAIASICVLTASLALAAPSEAVPASAEQNPYFDVTKEDPFGNRSIAVLGDSISHGANAPEIYNDSYLALVKQSLWEEVGYENYGFASIENTMRNNSGMYREVHHTSWGSEWTEQRIDDNLGRFNLSASKKGSKLDFTVEKDYEYFTVYYEVNEDGGTFDVITDEGTVTVDTSKGLTDKIGRSEYIAFPASRSFTIEVSSEGKKVAINGVGYYNNTDGVVINNYASNGSKLIDVSDNILDFACQSGVLIMAHGYNDSHFQQNDAANQAKFTEKIDYIIQKVSETGCKVIVNDMCWNCNSENFFRKELSRLAEETGGLYVSAQDAYGAEMLKNLSDGVHPGVEGHHIIGNLMLSKMVGEEAPTLPTTTTTQPPVIDGYVRVYDAPLNDASLWKVADGAAGGAMADYEDAQAPALILTPTADGLELVRTNDSAQPWTSTSTYVDQSLDLAGNILYYDIEAECSWNLTVSFGTSKDTTEENEVLKLGSYIARAHGTEIGYDNDVPAGSYKGALDLTAVMQEAIDAGKLVSSALDMPEYTYVGRFNVWHVSGTVDVSKVIVKDLFLGHEDTSSTGSTDSATDSSATDSTATDATVNTTGGSSGQTTGSSPETGENIVLLIIDVALLAISAIMLLVTKKKSKN